MQTFDHLPPGYVAIKIAASAIQWFLRESTLGPQKRDWCCNTSPSAVPRLIRPSDGATSNPSIVASTSRVKFPQRQKGGAIGCGICRRCHNRLELTQILFARFETMSAILTGQAQSKILAHMTKCGGAFANWYCGIACDPRDCLFNRHGVDEHGGTWIYRDCGTDAAARAVERHFLSLGCRGGGSGGGPDTRYVYAYCITSTTRE
jgi:hypothetical protein